MKKLLTDKHFEAEFKECVNFAFRAESLMTLYSDDKNLKERGKRYHELKKGSMTWVEREG